MSSCKCAALDVLHCTTTSPSCASLTKVIHPLTGQVLEFSHSVAAAELMLDFPHHFVCHSSSFALGQRVVPLPSDHPLQPAQLYFLLPMHKLHARLSPHDMADMANALTNVGKAKHPKNSASKDALPKSDAFQRNSIRLANDQYPSVLQLQVPSTQPLIDKCRSWRPKLQTINESPRTESTDWRFERIFIFSSSPREHASEEV